MTEKAKDSITISKTEYASLQQDSAHLNELINRGVDNWGGYVGPYNNCEGCGESVSWSAEKCTECGEEMDDGY